jgi:large subunit ribosomal protein L18
MSVKFTGKNIYVQFIDDAVGATIAAVSSQSKNAPDGVTGANRTSADIIGKAAAEAAKSKNIVEVVFDRGSAKYHGKLKALADAARGAGLKF